MESAAWKIRPARRADLPCLGPIEAVGDAQFPAGRLPGEPGSDNVPESELAAGVEQGLLQVAVEAGGSGRVIAFQLARDEGEHLHLRQIVVLPEWQGRGIGRRLISGLATEARRRGLRGITLTTFADIPWNAPLYRKLGFRELDESTLADPAFHYLAAELTAERAAGMTGRVGMLRQA
jgi:GNAT superfamily N-acetyltransferase